MVKVLSARASGLIPCLTEIDARLQTGESWNKVVRPKALGAWNLDAATRDLAALEHFVCFSSIVATLGNAGVPCP